MSITVFGSINFDLTTYTPRLPRPGETLLGYSFLTAAGGKGANQAVAAARLGSMVQLIGRIGDDAFGQEVLAAITAENVSTTHVITDPNNNTGLAVICVDDEAQNSIVAISGANMAFNEEDVARCIEVLVETKVLLMQLEVPLAVNLAVAEAARERGILTLLDPAPARPLPLEAYGSFDIITPNETETEALLGFRPTNVDEADRAAKILQGRGVTTAVIKLGAQGVYYATADDSGFVPAYRVKAVDTVAAGDAFNGGLAVALVRGKPISEAVRWGAAAGAIAVTRPGAIPAMPTFEELISLLATDH